MENDLILNLDTDDSAIDASINKLQQYERLLGKISSQSEQIARTSTRVAKGGAAGGGGMIGSVGAFAGMNMFSGSSGKKIEQKAQRVTSGATSKAVTKATEKSLLASQVGGFGYRQTGNIGRQLGAGSITAGAVARTAQRGAGNRMGSVIGSVLGSKFPVIGTMIGAFVGAYLGSFLDKGMEGMKEIFGDEKTQKRREEYESKMNDFLNRDSRSLDRFIRETPREQRRMTQEAFGRSRRGFDPSLAWEEDTMRKQLLQRQSEHEVGRRREGFGEEARSAQRDTYVENAVRRLLRP